MSSARMKLQILTSLNDQVSSSSRHSDNAKASPHTSLKTLLNYSIGSMLCTHETWGWCVRAANNQHDLEYIRALQTCYCSILSGCHYLSKKIYLYIETKSPSTVGTFKAYHKSNILNSRQISQFNDHTPIVTWQLNYGFIWKVFCEYS